MYVQVKIIQENVKNIRKNVGKKKTLGKTSFDKYTGIVRKKRPQL